ncbi:MAG TPA: acetate--CoA ligase family protein, partial [Thermoanaerobaculia bacterium]|nr:acetate--CoA ligase family protein [Thermoanaerobaculia bacterium]
MAKAKDIGEEPREHPEVWLGRILQAARAAGQTHLLEPEGLAVARALGLGIPYSVLVKDSREARTVPLASFPGDRIVVKVVSPRILHKSDVGGVAVVPKSPAAVRAALREMEHRFARQEVVGYSLNELIPHDAALGGQLLLGMRWTDDFGPVVTLGPGGIYTEYLAANLRPGRDVAILSPALASRERIEAALTGKVITPLLTGVLRGQPARVKMDTLKELLETFLRFAACSMPHAVAEFEINPLVPTAHGLVALDALLKLGHGESPAAPPRPLGKIRNLLAPRSVAVVGVSEAMNPGHVILKNLLREGFDPSRLYVVKPGRKEIDSCRCVPDLKSLPERVDLAVLAIDAGQIPAAVGEVLAGEKAESLILIPGGLGETSGSGTAASRLQASLERSRATTWGGPVVNGGNCLGLRSVPGRINTLFIPEPRLRFSGDASAPAALLSQSGAFAVARASRLAAMNPRYLVTFGNQLDLTAGDYLTYLADDPEIQVFSCYVEGFRPLDGRRWLEAAARITASGRTVILYRAGRTPAGAGAAASHTASIAGDFAVTRELARSAGVLLAHCLADFEDLTLLACHLHGRNPAGPRLGALSNAGFECVAIADNLGPFRLARFAPDTRRRLTDLLAAHRLATIVDVHNPLDVTPILNDAGYEDAARLVLEDPGVDLGVIGCVPLTGCLDT